jgi:hypothetical protein
MTKALFLSFPLPTPTGDGGAVRYPVSSQNIIIKLADQADMK